MSTTLQFALTTDEVAPVLAKLRGERLSVTDYATVAAVLRRWQGAYDRATKTPAAP